MLKRILDKDDQLSPEDKEHLLAMMDQRKELEQEIRRMQELIGPAEIGILELRKGSLRSEP